MDCKDKNNAAFVYSVNILKILLSMKLITDEEYDKIVTVNKAHYGAENICV